MSVYFAFIEKGVACCGGHDILSVYDEYVWRDGEPIDR